MFQDTFSEVQISVSPTLSESHPFVVLGETILGPLLRSSQKKRCAQKDARPEGPSPEGLSQEQSIRVLQELNSEPRGSKSESDQGKPPRKLEGDPTQSVEWAPIPVTKGTLFKKIGISPHRKGSPNLLLIWATLFKHS